MKTLLHFASQVKKVVLLFFNLRAVMALGLSFVPTQPRGNRVRVGGRWELEDGAGAPALAQANPSRTCSSWSLRGGFNLTYGRCTSIPSRVKNSYSGRRVLCFLLHCTGKRAWGPGGCSASWCGLWVAPVPSTPWSMVFPLGMRWSSFSSCGSPQVETV